MGARDRDGDVARGGVRGGLWAKRKPQKMLISWIWGEVVGARMSILAHVKGGPRAREWRQGKDATTAPMPIIFMSRVGLKLNELWTDNQRGDGRSEHNDTGLSSRLALINTPLIVLGL